MSRGFTSSEIGPEGRKNVAPAVRACCSNAVTAIPRLSKAGMLSHSEGWGGLFKDEQYRLMRSASRASIRWLRVFEQTTPALRACPSLLRRGLALAVLGNRALRPGLRSVAAPRLNREAQARQHEALIKDAAITETF